MKKSFYLRNFILIIVGIVSSFLWFWYGDNEFHKVIGVINGLVTFFLMARMAKVKKLLLLKEEYIQEKAKNEYPTIAKAFKQSEEIGVLELTSAISSYKEFIMNENQENTSIDLMGDLKLYIKTLIENMDNKWKFEALSEIQISNIYNISEKEIKRIYEKY